MEGQRKLKAAKVLLIGAGGLGSPLGALSGRGGRRHDRAGRFRRRRRDATSTARCSTARATSAGRSWTRPRDRLARPQPARRGRAARGAADSARTRWSCSRTTTSSSTARTTSRPATWSTTPACCSASRTSTARSSASRGRSSVFCDARTGRATAACSPSRRRRAWCRAAPRAACWACCRGSIGTLQATEAIKLILGIGEPLVGRLLLFDALAMRFRELQAAQEPDCPVCGEHPTVTELIDYEAVLRHRSRTAEAAETASRRSRRPSWRSGSMRRRAAHADRRARAARVGDREPGPTARG